MKKQLLFGALLGVVLLYAIVPAHVAWVKIKEDPQGVSYTDTSAYRCACRGTEIDTMYYKIKQIPTHSNAKYIINNASEIISGYATISNFRIK